MNKAFEKILKRLEEAKNFEYLNGVKRFSKKERIAFDNAKEIVQEVAEEYKGGWIACSERLPDKNGMYICTQNTYDLETNKKIIKISTELVEFYNGKWRRAKSLVITHWQPLPEAYQPKGELKQNENK